MKGEFVNLVQTLFMGHVVTWAVPVDVLVTTPNGCAFMAERYDDRVQSRMMALVRGLPRKKITHLGMGNCRVIVSLPTFLPVPKCRVHNHFL
ncbi:hypothetical protein EDD17DRAFT_1601153 [Pisolithus thermaeus]|nr:hypothetical protein EDD17DRAFT_1601153 [Pisolithus thermaeus]